MKWHGVCFVVPTKAACPRVKIVTHGQDGKGDGFVCTRGLINLAADQLPTAITHPHSTVLSLSRPGDPGTALRSWQLMSRV